MPLPKRVWMVINRLDVRCALPVEVIPDHVLRRATDTEIERIQAFLAKYGAPHNAVIYECEPQAVDERGQHWVPVEPQLWKYYVIEPPQEGTLIGGLSVRDAYQYDFHKAARLCQVEIKCPVVLGPDYNSFTSPLRRSPLPQMLQFRADDVLDDDALNELRESFDAVSAIPPAYSDIARAVDMFYHLQDLAADHLYVLGLFSIIECLLTHDPEKTQHSLTHQISSKIPLLCKRMKKGIDYSTFQNASVETVWKKLYEYRSKIAHGEEPDLTGKLALLDNRQRVSDFLDRAVKALIRHAMLEPDLILDLRKV
jgi:hypothetical protein